MERRKEMVSISNSLPSLNGEVAMGGQAVASGCTLSAAHSMLSTRFTKSPYLSIRRVDVRYHEGVVTLRGHVPTFYLKQLAQRLATGLPGVEEVVNHIEVA
jgi:osmotically-inducible protein OsmY